MNKICRNCDTVNNGILNNCSNCGKSLSDTPAVAEYTPFTPSTSSSAATYDGRDNIVSMGAWLLIFIVLAIPIINLVAIFVLAFATDNENIKNFGKASLILMGIAVFLLFLRACG